MIMQYITHRISRRAFTLVELLVAIAVITVLAGIALPTMKNSLKGERLSRASSLLQSVIEEARARSIASGGGGGIIIDRRGTNTVADRCEALRIRFASTAAPYTGEPGNEEVLIGAELGASAPLDLVTLWFSPYATQMVRAATDLGQNADQQTLFRPGNYVQLGSGGRPLRIESIAFAINNGTVNERNNSNLSASEIPDAEITQWVRVVVSSNEPNRNFREYIGTSVTFQISREPRPAIAPPIELPRGTSIDLTSSGVGRFGNQFSPMAVDGNYIDETAAPFVTGARDYQSIFILFGRRGEVSQVVATTLVGLVPTATEIPITGDIYLLVGEAGQVKTDPEGQLEDSDTNYRRDQAKDGTTPLLNPESIWLTIKSRSGDIVASPWIDPTDSAVALVPASSVLPPGDDFEQQSRVQTVIARTRSGAVQSTNLPQ